MTYDADGSRRTGLFPTKMPDQESTGHQPFERRMPLYCGWESRMCSYCIPFANQDLKLFKRDSRLRRLEFRMFIHVTIPFVVMITVRRRISPEQRVSVTLIVVNSVDEVPGWSDNLLLSPIYTGRRRISNSLVSLPFIRRRAKCTPPNRRIARYILNLF